jgi:hypothetical protein
VIGKEIGLAKASNPSACTAIKSATYWLSRLNFEWKAMLTKQ